MSITLGVRRRRRVIKPTPSPIPRASPFDPTNYPLPTRPRSIAVHVRSADRAIEQTLNDQTRSSIRGKFSSSVVACHVQPAFNVSSGLGGPMAWSRRYDDLVKLTPLRWNAIFS